MNRGKYRPPQHVIALKLLVESLKEDYLDTNKLDFIKNDKNIKKYIEERINKLNEYYNSEERPHEQVKYLNCVYQFILLIKAKRDFYDLTLNEESKKISKKIEEKLKNINGYFTKIVSCSNAESKINLLQKENEVLKVQAKPQQQNQDFLNLRLRKRTNQSDQGFVDTFLIERNNNQGQGFGRQ